MRLAHLLAEPSDPWEVKHHLLHTKVVWGRVSNRGVGGSRECMGEGGGGSEKEREREREREREGGEHSVLINKDMF